MNFYDLQVGFSGAQGTGKSTLISDVSLALEQMGFNLPILDGDAREILRRENVTENLASLPLTKGIAIQQEILDNISHRRSITAPFLADRTEADSLAYSQYWFSRLPEAQAFLQHARDMTFLGAGNYDIVFLAPPNIELVGDDVRSDCKSYQCTIHYLILGILNDYNYPYVIIEEADRDKRVEEVLHKLKALFR